MADADSSHVKVRFALQQDANGWPPVVSEGLWAVGLGGDRYRVDNTPWFVRNVAAEDVVIARAGSDDVLWATEKAEWGGRMTVRVIPFREGPLRGSRQEVLDAFAALGVSGEGIEKYGMVALDIGPEVEVVAVKALLRAGRADGRWEYEEGCVSAEWLNL